jgi:hypothetical protein
MHFHRLHALVHVYFQHLEAMRIDNSSGAGSNREIFISQATFDSSWRGLAVYDNSYIDIAGNPYRALLRLLTATTLLRRSSFCFSGRSYRCLGLVCRRQQIVITIACSVRVLGCEFGRCPDLR